MGRYKLSIEKLLGKNPEKAITKIELYGLIPKLRDGDGSLSAQDVDTEGNGSFEYENQPFTEKSVRLTSFDVTDPVARFIRLVTISNAESHCPIWEPTSSSKSVGDEKSVQILHKRKSAARVHSVSEATSIVLNTKSQDCEESETILDAIESNEDEEILFQDAIIKGKHRTIKIDLFQLRNFEKVTIRVDTERDSVDFESGSAIKVFDTDENGNAQEIENSPSLNSSLVEPSGSQNTEVDVEVSPTQAECIENNQEDEFEEIDQVPESPIKLTVTIGNELMIFVELDNNFETSDTSECIPTTGREFESIGNAGEASTQSIVEPDTLFFLPYQDKLLETIPPSSKTFRLPSYLKEKKQPERDERKQFLRKLILQRLLEFGTPNVTAHDIMDTWYSGYVQHRSLSYRIPKTRVMSKQKLIEGEVNEIQKPVQIKLGARMSDATGFIESFVYHSNFIKGILNSVTCTALEAVFYLMIPHFKTRTDKSIHHLPGAGISPTFIKDWLHLLFTAAYQLKPTDPIAIIDMVKKEMKLVKHILQHIEKEHKKMKERLRYIQDKAENLKEKTYDRIKLDPELANEIQRDEEPKNYSGFGHLQLAGFTGPQIFPNYLHFLTGKFGLFLKKDVEEQWFPFSDLNFLERRVIFLGLMDHIHASFDAVLITLRHLQEIYTPGYPMNLLTRFKPLFELIRRDKPYQLLATESKLSLYSAACACVGALKRFKYIYKELMTIVKDASVGIQKFEYSASTSADFALKLGSNEKVNKINLIVPFPTLNLEGFTNLSERGTSISLDETQKQDPL